jgi:hypothetical protein
MLVGFVLPSSCRRFETSVYSTPGVPDGMFSGSSENQTLSKLRISAIFTAVTMSFASRVWMRNDSFAVERKDGESDNAWDSLHSRVALPNSFQLSQTILTHIKLNSGYVEIEYTAQHGLPFSKPSKQDRNRHIYSVAACHQLHCMYDTLNPPSPNAILTSP